MYARSATAGRLIARATEPTAIKGNTQMPKIIVRASTSDGEADLVTLSERVVADNLLSRHYTTQLIERVSWATADAEALESEGRASESNAKLHGASRAIGDRVPASAATPGLTPTAATVASDDSPFAALRTR